MVLTAKHVRKQFRESRTRAIRDRICRVHKCILLAGRKLFAKTIHNNYGRDNLGYRITQFAGTLVAFREELCYVTISENGRAVVPRSQRVNSFFLINASFICALYVNKDVKMCRQGLLLTFPIVFFGSEFVCCFLVKGATRPRVHSRKAIVYIGCL